MSSTSIPNFVWWPIAVSICILILPVTFLISIFAYKMYAANHAETEICGIYFDFDTTYDSFRNSYTNFQTIHSQLETIIDNMKADSKGTQKTPCSTKELEQVSSLLNEEKKGLEKVNNQFQQSKSQLQRHKKTCRD